MIYESKPWEWYLDESPGCMVAVPLLLLKRQSSAHELLRAEVSGFRYQKSSNFTYEIIWRLSFPWS